MRFRFPALAVAVCLAPLAQAQLGVPGVRLPQLPAAVTNPINQAVDTTTATLDNTLTAARRAAAANLIRDNRQSIDTDPNGEPVVRGRLLAVGLTDAARAAVLAAGFSPSSTQLLAALDLRVDSVDAPRGQSTRRALQTLQRLVPAAQWDYDHLYSGSGEVAASTLPPLPAEGVAGAAGSARVGLIDAGIAQEHDVFHGAAISSWGCQDHVVPSSHGTAVASLLVGAATPFRGAAPDAHLYAADVYCGLPTGGAIETVVAALGWLSQQQVAVINISLVGPDNAVLRQVVAVLVARGYLLVAAVGNDGPAAPALYPAAYAGVIGVTAIDAQHHVLLEAERGSQVMFAAPGADMVAAENPRGYANVRGTSFAAPLVAGLLAQHLQQPDRAHAAAAVEALQHDAEPVAGGRNDRYGYGIVADALRVAPSIISALLPESSH